MSDRTQPPHSTDQEGADQPSSPHTHQTRHYTIIVHTINTSAPPPPPPGPPPTESLPSLRNADTQHQGKCSNMDRGRGRTRPEPCIPLVPIPRVALSKTGPVSPLATRTDGNRTTRPPRGRPSHPDPPELGPTWLPPIGSPAWHTAVDRIKRLDGISCDRGSIGGDPTSSSRGAPRPISEQPRHPDTPALGPTWSTSQQPPRRDTPALGWRPGDHWPSSFDSDEDLDEFPALPPPKQPVPVPVPTPSTSTPPTPTASIWKDEIGSLPLSQKAYKGRMDPSAWQNWPNPIKLRLMVRRHPRLAFMGGATIAHPKTAWLRHQLHKHETTRMHRVELEEAYIPTKEATTVLKACNCAVEDEESECATVVDDNEAEQREKLVEAIRGVAEDKERAYAEKFSGGYGVPGLDYEVDEDGDLRTAQPKEEKLKEEEPEEEWKIRSFQGFDMRAEYDTEAGDVKTADTQTAYIHGEGDLKMEEEDEHMNQFNGGYGVPGLDYDLDEDEDPELEEAKKEKHREDTTEKDTGGEATHIYTASWLKLRSLSSPFSSSSPPPTSLVVQTPSATPITAEPSQPRSSKAPGSKPNNLNGFMFRAMPGFEITAESEPEENLLSGEPMPKRRKLSIIAPPEPEESPLSFGAMAKGMKTDATNSPVVFGQKKTRRTSFSSKIGGSSGMMDSFSRASSASSYVAARTYRSSSLSPPPSSCGSSSSGRSNSSSVSLQLWTGTRLNRYIPRARGKKSTYPIPPCDKVRRNDLPHSDKARAINTIFDILDEVPINRPSKSTKLSEKEKAKKRKDIMDAFWTDEVKAKMLEMMDAFLTDEQEEALEQMDTLWKKAEEVSAKRVAEVDALWNMEEEMEQEQLEIIEQELAKPQEEKVRWWEKKQDFNQRSDSEPEMRLF